MAWTTPIDWLAKAIGYPPSRADLQTISDDLNELGGWIDSAYPWVYVSATEIKIVGHNVAFLYPKGAKLSCTDGGVTKCFYVERSNFGLGPDTEILITGGSDYSLSGGAITNPRYSNALVPAGFPDCFNDLPPYGGWVATPTRTCSFTIVNHQLIYDYYISGDGSGTSRYITLPFEAVKKASNPLSYCYDNGNLILTSPNWASVDPASNRLAFCKGSATSWTNAANLTAVEGQIVVTI